MEIQREIKEKERKADLEKKEKVKGEEDKQHKTEIEMIKANCERKKK